MKRIDHYFATQCPSSINTASILLFNVWEWWTDDLQTKLRGLWTQGCICPLRLPCFHLISELYEPTTTALIPFSRKLDTWSVINETRGKITRHTVWISSLLQFAMFEEIYRKRRDMKGKTFSWSWRQSHQNISTTEVGFYHLALIFSDIFKI